MENLFEKETLSPDIATIGDIHSDFNEKVGKIKSMVFKLLCGSGDTFNVDVKINNDNAVIRYADGTYKNRSKEDFINELRGINISDWRWFSHHQKTGRVNPDTLMWRMSVEFQDDSAAVNVYGDADCPDNFNELLALLGYNKEGNKYDDLAGGIL